MKPSEIKRAQMKEFLEMRRKQNLNTSLEKNTGEGLNSMIIEGHVD